MIVPCRTNKLNGGQGQNRTADTGIFQNDRSQLISYFSITYRDACCKRCPTTHNCSRMIHVIPPQSKEILAAEQNRLRTGVAILLAALLAHFPLTNLLVAQWLTQNRDFSTVHALDPKNAIFYKCARNQGNFDCLERTSLQPIAAVRAQS